MTGYEILVMVLLSIAIAEFIVFGFVINVMRKIYRELESSFDSIIFANENLCKQRDQAVKELTKYKEEK